MNTPERELRCHHGRYALLVVKSKGQPIYCRLLCRGCGKEIRRWKKGEER